MHFSFNRGVNQMRKRKTIRRGFALFVSLVMLFGMTFSGVPTFAGEEIAKASDAVEAVEPSGDSVVNSEESPIEEPPVEVPPVENSSAGEPPVEEPPVEAPPVENSSVEEPPVEGSPVEAPPVENSSAEEPRNEALKSGNNVSGGESADIADLVPDNPDRLKAPDDSPYAGKINYNIFPATPFPAITSTKSRAKGDMQPGEVKLYKYATEVPGKVNVWDITLRIEGKDGEPVHSDIILVMDTSGSMSGNKISEAKTAANSFINTLLDPSSPTSTTTRIGIVPFASKVDVQQVTQLTDNKTTLLDAVKALKATGGTFTQAGVRQAEAMLENSDAAMKHIVLLSDGQPTYSYKLSNPDDYLDLFDSYSQSGYYWGTPYTYHYFLYETNTDAPESAYRYGNNDRVGKGNDLRYKYDESESGPRDNLTITQKYYNHGNSAIAEAGFAKEAGYTVWTIAFDAGSGASILESMATPGNAYTATQGELNEIFASIAGEIGASIKDVSIIDPMGGGFEVPEEAGGVYDITTIPATPEATYDPVNKIITWNPGTLTEPLSGDSTIKYAELKYTVEINDDILNQPPQGVDENLYPTNGKAKVTYTGVDGVSQEESFPIPLVDPILLIVEKVLYDSHGKKMTTDPHNRVFTIEITGDTLGTDSTPLYHQIFNLKLGERRIMTNLRLEDTYAVEETEVKYGGHDGTVGLLSDYTTTVNVYGVDQTSFEIEQGDPDSTVLVTNREEPKGIITVYKIFKPVDESKSRTRQSLPTFSFSLTHPDGTIEPFELTAGNNKVFNNLPYGEYIVEETNSAGFDATYSDTDNTNGSTLDDGIVTLTILAKEDSVTVTNTPKPGDQKVNVVGKKIWSGGPTADHVAVQMLLKRNGVTMSPQPTYTVSPASGTANEFAYTWTGLQKYDDYGVEYVYTIDEDEISVPNCYNKTVSEDGLTVTNSYQIPTGDVTATKEWKDGPSTHPTVWFKLYRNIAGDDTPVAVPGAALLKLEHGTTSVTWNNLEKTDLQGNAYIFSVKEVNADGDDFTPANYEKSGEGTLAITNKYVQPQTDENVIGTKYWVNGPAEKPAVEFELWRRNGTARNGERVVAATAVVNNKVDFGKQLKTDVNGVEYEYYVVEPTVPANYTKREIGLAVVNTYVQPLTDVSIIGTKIWVNGPAEKPAVEFELWRKNGTAGDGEKVVVATALTGTAVDFGKQLKTDINGVEYEYYVKEATVLENYSKVESGLTVTNTYTPDKITIDVTKEWVDQENEAGIRPESVTIRLFADEEDTGKTIVLSEDVEWTGVFTDLDKQHLDGVEIVYSVEEEEIDSRYYPVVSGDADEGFKASSLQTTRCSQKSSLLFR